MDGGSGFERGDWRHGRWHRLGGGDPRAPEPLDLLLQAGLWLAGVLALASVAPPELLPAVARELLFYVAFLVSVVGLLRGESLTLTRFNRQDVALALLAAAQVAGLLIDPAAVEAYLRQVEAAAG